MRVFCDFDGTVSQIDATDAILRRFARTGWQDLEAAWEEGRIGSAACMQGQIALIEASRDDLHAALDVIEIDPGFAALVAWCKARRVPCRIVSDGVDYFIQRILKRHGFDGLAITANRLRQTGARAWRLETEPGADCLSGLGVCKCQVVKASSDRDVVVFVGDGRTDICVAKSADLLFAKDKLMAWCRAHSVPHHSFETLGDVAIALDRLTTEATASVASVAGVP